MFNFHVFVLCSTIAYYFILKSYKNAIQNERDDKKQSNLIYLLFIPVTLYIAFLFTSGQPTSDNESNGSAILLSPYPISVSTK